MSGKVAAPHEDLTYRINGAAMAVHRRLGPGYKEVTYQQKYLGQVITYLNHTGLDIGLLINFGERSLRPRRVFPSPLATEFRVNYQWLFMPDWLKAQRRDSVPSV